MTKVPKWVWIALVGASLALPMLGSYGLWDPAEIKEADIARAVAEAGSYGDVTVGGKHAARPVLQTWLVALGFKFFGINELAGRLPLALCLLGALLLAYRFVRRLFDEQTALVAAFFLATTPVFIFQGRQLTSDIVFYLTQIAALGGLLAYLAPADGRRLRVDLAIGAVGLVGGFLARGLMIGTLLPLIALGLALAILWSLRPEPAPDDAAALEAQQSDDLVDVELPELGSGVPAPQPGVAALLAGPGLQPLLVALGAAALAIVALGATLTQGKLLIMGGIYHKVALPPTFDQSLRVLAFGAFPWIALSPLALWAFGAALREPPRSPEALRERFVKLVLVLIVAAGYLFTVVWPGLFAKVRFLPLPWLILLTGIWAWEAYRRGEERPLWGVLAALLLLMLHQDFYMEPGSLGFSHLIDPGRYPEKLDIKLPVRLFGLWFALLAYLTLGGLPKEIARLQAPEGRCWTARLLGWVVSAAQGLAVGLNLVSRSLVRVAGEGRRALWALFATSAFVFASWCALWLIPQLSLHASNKALFETYHKCKQSGERLAQYRVSGRGAAYYNKGQVDELRHQGEFFARLRKSERTFVLMPASYLGSIDQAARQQHVNYHVLDDSNSHYLILSNKLGGRGCDRDKNPLRKLVLRQRPKPQHAINVNFENKVRLIGYDLPRTVTRGGSFKITLYFEVLAKVPANYKIFIHFDQPASRFHGDHAPVKGMYPTQYWLQGDFIKDPQEVELPLLTTSSGSYEVLMGFWQGSRRLKVIEGPNDGVNRSKIAILRVR